MANLRFILSIIVGKLIRWGLMVLGKSATALPGNIALKIEPKLLKIINKKCKRILVVTGTNGKTTTNNLIYHILKEDNKSILTNLKGANMPQGIASTFLEDHRKSYDWGIFEVDEGSFKRILKDINPEYIIVTNFFRDQLDRYAEIENTISMVYETIKPLNTTLILNADDPLVSQFAQINENNIFYGVKESEFSSKTQNVMETQFCPLCDNHIDYEYYNYGQLGLYYCKKCGFKNPDYHYYISNIRFDGDYCFDIGGKERFNDVCFGYNGVYNVYNVCAAFAFCSEIGIDSDKIVNKIENFIYKLGRMEEFTFHNKIVKIVLIKNPIGLTEVIKSIYQDKRKKSILFILNDNPADGKDVSWIWDAEMNKISEFDNLKTVYCSGKRAEDIALRIKYSDIPTKQIKIDDDVKKSIEEIIDENVEIVYLLPTYTAVFQTRDIVLKFQQKSKKGMY